MKIHTCHLLFDIKQKEYLKFHWNIILFSESLIYDTD